MRSDFDTFEHHTQQNKLVLHDAELCLTVAAQKMSKWWPDDACRAKNHWALAVTNVRPHANKVLIVDCEAINRHASRCRVS